LRKNAQRDDGVRLDSKFDRVVVWAKRELGLVALHGVVRPCVFEGKRQPQPIRARHTTKVEYAENGAPAIFRGLPGFEQESGIIELEEAAGLPGERTLPIDCLVLDCLVFDCLVRCGHFGDFERRRFFPAEAA
jgi:hypothetical protein